VQNKKTNLFKIANRISGKKGKNKLIKKGINSKKEEKKKQKTQREKSKEKYYL